MSFGASGFGDFAFSEQDHVTLDSTGFHEWLAEITAPRCWLLELEALSLASVGGVSGGFSDSAFDEVTLADDQSVGAGGSVTLYYSTHGFTSRLKERVAYLNLPGSAGNYASTPDAPSNRITGDIAVIADVAPNDWTPPANGGIGRKWNAAGNKRSWDFRIGTSGVLQAVFTSDGVTQLSTSSTVAPGFTDGVRRKIAVTRQASTGTVKYWTSSDGGATYTQLGADRSTTAGALFNSDQPVIFGMSGSGGDFQMIGKGYGLEIYNGIPDILGGSAGSLAVDFDASRFADGALTAAMDTGEVWTVNQSGSPAAEIVDEGEVFKGDPDSRVFYDGRVKEGITVERSIAGRDGIGGLTRVFAQVQLVNRDGALDNIARDYAIDGRRATLLIGPADGARSDFGNAFTGVVERVGVSTGDMTLVLSDGIAKLDRPVNETAYAGSGGLEGGADLAGKSKPKCYGKVYNVAPPLVDSASLIYQVHDGAINDVPAVRDRGVALAKVVGAPGAGEYQVNAAAGTFTLGATPAGTVTCDVEGDAPAAGYTTKAGDIILRLLSGVLTSTEINPTSFVMLNQDVPGPVGIWIGTEPRTIADAAGEILAGIGAFGGFSRSGAFTVGLVASPSGVSPAASYTEIEIGELERESLPAPVEPAVWRANAGYQKNYTVQNDVAAGATAAARTFAAQPLRIASAENPTVRSQRLLARDYGPAGAVFADQADADTEATRLLALWGGAPGMYRVPLKRMDALLHDLGDVVELTHSRHGFALGKSARVLRTALRDTQVELVVIA